MRNDCGLADLLTNHVLPVDMLRPPPRPTPAPIAHTVGSVSTQVPAIALSLNSTGPFCMRSSRGSSRGSSEHFHPTRPTRPISSCNLLATSSQGCHEDATNITDGRSQHMNWTRCTSVSSVKPAFHDTDTDILARILEGMSASVSMSVPWTAAYSAM